MPTIVPTIIVEGRDETVITFEAIETIWEHSLVVQELAWALEIPQSTDPNIRNRKDFDKLPNHEKAVSRRKLERSWNIVQTLVREQLE